MENLPKASRDRKGVSNLALAQSRDDSEPGGYEVQGMRSTIPLANREAEGGEDGGDGGESDVDNYAPLVLVFSCHNRLKVYGLRFIVYGKP